MTLRRIYSNQRLRTGTTVTLADEAANHVLRVLRLRRGDALVVFDGSGVDYAAVVAGMRRDTVEIEVGAGQAVARESPLQITLLQGVCRGPRMDTVIQKATELGVTTIVPVLTGRTVVRLADERVERKHGHWARVAVAAAEQSGRGVVPTVAAAQSLEAALAGLPGGVGRWLLDPEGEQLGDRPAVGSPLALLVGPEGGLTEAEREQAAAAGFRRWRLGPRILRTETAPLVALAVLQYLLGDLG
jgi:16S rRNA (uracil1498-N3)-methyltransferase